MHSPVRVRMRSLLLGVGMAATLALPLVSHASNNRADTDTFTQTIGGMFINAADSLRFTNPIDRDLFAAGSVVSVDNEVGGDVFAAGQTVTITGTVNGSVRVAGNSVTIAGPVHGNVLVVGSTVILTKDAVIDGYLNAYGATVVIDGVVHKESSLAGAAVDINGTLNGAVQIDADATTVSDNAVLQSAVQVRGPEAPTISDAATGTDNITFEQVDDDDTGKNTDTASFFGAFGILAAGYWYIAMSIVALALLLLFPGCASGVASAMSAQRGATWGKGALLVFVTPIAVVALLMTLVGIPLAILTGMAYAVGMLLVQPLVGYWLGQKIFKAKADTSLALRYLYFLIGYVLVGLACMIPILGWLLGFVLAVWVFGAAWEHGCRCETPKAKPKKKKA